MGTMTGLPAREALRTGFRHRVDNDGSDVTNFGLDIMGWLSFPFPTEPGSTVIDRRGQRGQASDGPENPPRMPISQHSGASCAGDRRGSVPDRMPRRGGQPGVFFPFLSESADSKSSLLLGNAR